MPERDAATWQELRALQQRAYGPDADIAADPAALGRLRDLEAMAREADHAPGPADARAGDTWQAIGVDPPENLVQNDTVSDEPAASPEAPVPPEPPVPPARPARRRWLIALWLGSLVVVAAAAVAGTLAVSPSVAGVPGARLEATLEKPLSDPPAGLTDTFGTPDTVAVYEFSGLNVAVDHLGGPPVMACLALVATGATSATSAAIHAPVGGGCVPGAFPATAQIVVSEDYPDETRERFADGTTLLFSWDGERVRVYAAPPEADSGSSPESRSP